MVSIPEIGINNKYGEYSWNWDAGKVCSVKILTATHQLWALRQHPKLLVGAFNLEKAILGDFFMIVKILPNIRLQLYWWHGDTAEVWHSADRGVWRAE